MDFYQNAVETELSAKVLHDKGMYRHAIYFYCLAIELYLKSRLYLVEFKEDLDISHDISGLYDALKVRFKSSKNLGWYMSRSRKYFNESRYPYRKIDTPNTHGTGCTLSSAIASFLALGLPLPQAVGRAEDYVHRAVEAGARYRTGKGHGPVHHFWSWWE